MRKGDWIEQGPPGHPSIHPWAPEPAPPSRARRVLRRSWMVYLFISTSVGEFVLLGWVADWGIERWRASRAPSVSYQLDPPIGFERPQWRDADEPLGLRT